jgi:hypothetical protein
MWKTQRSGKERRKRRKNKERKRAVERVWKGKKVFGFFAPDKIFLISSENLFLSLFESFIRDCNKSRPDQDTVKKLFNF